MGCCSTTEPSFVPQIVEFKEPVRYTLEQLERQECEVSLQCSEFDKQSVRLSKQRDESGQRGFVDDSPTDLLVTAECGCFELVNPWSSIHCEDHCILAMHTRANDSGFSGKLQFWTLFHFELELYLSLTVVLASDEILQHRWKVLIADEHGRSVFEFDRRLDELDCPNKFEFSPQCDYLAILIGHSRNVLFHCQLPSAAELLSMPEDALSQAVSFQRVAKVHQFHFLSRSQLLLTFVDTFPREVDVNEEQQVREAAPKKKIADGSFENGKHFPLLKKRLSPRDILYVLDLHTGVLLSLENWFGYAECFLCSGQSLIILTFDRTPAFIEVFLKQLLDERDPNVVRLDEESECLWCLEVAESLDPQASDWDEHVVVLSYRNCTTKKECVWQAGWFAHSKKSTTSPNSNYITDREHSKLPLQRSDFLQRGSDGRLFYFGRPFHGPKPHVVSSAEGEYWFLIGSMRYGQIFVGSVPNWSLTRITQPGISNVGQTWLSQGIGIVSEQRYSRNASMFKLRQLSRFHILRAVLYSYQAVYDVLHSEFFREIRELTELTMAYAWSESQSQGSSTEAGIRRQFSRFAESKIILADFAGVYCQNLTQVSGDGGGEMLFLGPRMLVRTQRDRMEAELGTDESRRRSLAEVCCVNWSELYDLSVGRSDKYARQLDDRRFGLETRGRKEQWQIGWKQYCAGLAGEYLRKRQERPQRKYETILESEEDSEESTQ